MSEDYISGCHSRLREVIWTHIVFINRRYKSAAVRDPVVEGTNLDVGFGLFETLIKYH